ncbi:MAG: SCO6745 family protein [Carbonactinosporaceae bacterium]
MSDGSTGERVHGSAEAGQTVTRLRGPIVDLGGAFMISPQARQAVKDAGLRGWQFYFRGRCGVLGEVDPAVVAAVTAFFPPDLVRGSWEAARDVLAPDEAVRRYAEACHAWGRSQLHGHAGAARLAELLERVARAADPVGAPLFAGWRAVPVPDDPPARAVHHAFLLREHRGGLHALAVLASGLTPLEATVAGPGGGAEAAAHRWPEPYPAAGAELRDRHARAERLTDRLAAPAYAVLDEDEGPELVQLARAACQAAGLAGGASGADTEEEAHGLPRHA